MSKGRAQKGSQVVPQRDEKYSLQFLCTEKSPPVSVYTLEIHKKMLIELLRGQNLFITLYFCSDVYHTKESEAIYWGKKYEFEVIF